MHCLGTLCKQLKLGHNKSFKLHSTYIQFNYKMQLSRWVNNRTFLDGKLAKMHTWSNFFMHSSYFSMYYVLGRKIVIINLMLACLHALGADRVFTWLVWLDSSLKLSQVPARLNPLETLNAMARLARHINIFYSKLKYFLRQVGKPP